MTTLYNVIAPVVDLVRADSPDQARANLAARLRTPGFEVYESPSEDSVDLTVFESEEPTEKK
jgi:hypothetical protein